MKAEQMEPRDDPPERSKRSMTRGEFLTAGATAAAAASLGYALPAAAGTTSNGERPVSATECKGTCPPETEAWAIPAGILNAFWSDCYPRLVAKWWRSDASVPSINNVANGTLATGSYGSPINPGLLANDIDNLPNNSPTFANRKRRVVDYLRGLFDLTEAGTPITDLPEIRFVPGGGFDYVLSDWGLDLFAPREPDLAELLHFYTFRRTGRPAIGLPDYRSKGASAIEADAPTGPSQAWIDPVLIIELLTSAQALGRMNDACLSRAVRCLEMSRVKPDPAGTDPPPLHLGPPTFVLSMETVTCVLENVRCWQISGAVFRGIQVELPRVVANIWLESALGGTGPYTATIFPGGGSIPYGDGLRDILGERMESRIPNMYEMDLVFHGPTSTPGHWVGDDIMITNRGLSFPTPSKRVVGATATAQRSHLLDAITFGHAGNPVFTDSMRTN